MDSILAQISRHPFLSVTTLANKGKAAFKFGAEVGTLGRDLNRPSGGLPSQPLVQFFTRGLNVAPLPADWHPLSDPPLCDRDGLSQEGGDLLPAFKHVRLLGSFCSLWHVELRCAISRKGCRWQRGRVGGILQNPVGWRCQ